MFSEVRTLAKGSPDAQYCELDVVPGELNRFTLTGCLTQRSEPLPLAFAVQNGASYAGAILKDELKKLIFKLMAICAAKQYRVLRETC